jgi:cyclophilin family peptidyl-prolyl cis-trans isomerase
MSKRKTRERQLAKLAARRAAERRRRKRQRILAGVVAGAAVLVVGLVLVLALTNNPSKHRARGTPTPSSTSPLPTPSPSPEAPYVPGTGKETDKKITPKPAPSEVACGAKAPPGAGKPKPQFDGPPPVTIDPANTYIATMVTSCGTIKFQLDPSTAPFTVNSFVFLADHHYFDGQYFHRLDTSIDVVQGGDPLGNGTGGPGYAIPDELTGHETYPPGTLAMAKGQPNTGGSQFFIITGPKGHLLDQNNVYTIFGKVIAGLDVAQKMQTMPIQNASAAASGDLTGQQPQQAIYIDSVTIRVVKATPSTGPTPSGTSTSTSAPSTSPTPSGGGSPSPSTKPSAKPSHNPSPTPSGSNTHTPGASPT